MMYDEGGGGTSVGSSRASEAAQERRALLTLFWCTTGPSWVNKDGWQDGDDSDLRDRWGIGLNLNEKHGSVTLVDLRRNGLSGAIPPEIGDLKQMRHLYLGDNGLQGSIPKSISQLSNLQILSLRGNNLKGDVVPELGSLSALQTLSLRDNHLTNAIPPELGRLTALKHLFFNNNDLRGPIPEELSKLKELEQLFLADNNLEGPIPPSLGGLVMLEELVLSGNGLSGPVPVELACLTCLKRLELDGNSISGDIPPCLSALTNLKVLYLNNNNLTGPIPPGLGTLSWLERLDVSNNQLAGSVPPELGQLFSLELLILNNNRLTGTIPCELGRLHNITLLLLSGNQLSEAVPIVGGKGLRQWQVAKRKAYLNGWSMMGRLAHLEKENAMLRKENDLLRKARAHSNGYSAVKWSTPSCSWTEPSAPTSTMGKVHSAMPVELSSEKTSSTTVTSTPYGPATFNSTEEAAAAVSPPAPSPSEHSRSRPLDAPAAGTASGEDTGAETRQAGGELETEAGEKGREFTCNSAQAPGEHRSVFHPRNSSMGEHSVRIDDEGQPTIDRIAARRALLMRNAASENAEGSPAEAGVRPTAARSDSSSTERFRGIGPSREGVSEMTKRGRARAVSASDGITRHTRHLKDLDESGGGLPTEPGTNGHFFVEAPAASRAESDEASLPSGVSAATISPLRSPLRRGANGVGEVHAHSTHGHGLSAAASGGSAAAAGGKISGVSAHGSTRVEKKMIGSESPRSAKSWASLIGMGPSFDLLNDASGNESGAARMNGGGVEGGGGGAVGAVSAGGGGAGRDQMQPQGARVSPVLLNSPMAQIMGLFRVGPVEGVPVNSDAGAAETPARNGSQHPVSAAAADGNTLPPITVVRDAEGNVRTDISLCSPE